MSIEEYVSYLKNYFEILLQKLTICRKTALTVASPRVQFRDRRRVLLHAGC